MVFEQEAFLLGRLLFGGFFIFNGVNHFMERDMLTGYAASKGAPMPGLVIPGTGLLLILGGLSMLTGLYPVVGAALLTVFFVTVTPIMHSFWAVGEDEKMAEMTQFLKNTALLGAVLMTLAIQQWPYALQL